MNKKSMMSITLKKLPKASKSEYSVYEYNDWQIEDTGVNWMVTRKLNPFLALHFLSLKDARNYIQNQEVA